MGTYINKGNSEFKDVVEDQYVDKTGMIAVINKTLNTERRFTCVTRCRRFGKTMAAQMLCAYYDKSCDSRSLFEELSISEPDKMVNGKMEDKQFEKAEYTGELLLVGINYDKNGPEGKKHTCKIERYTKE